MANVDISKIINVTLMGTPVGLSEFNVNTLALLTSEAPAEAFEDGYKVYTSPDDIATDFGTDSETYEQAVAIFSQSPNILTGNGYLAVIPLETVSSPTHGTMLTEKPGDLSKFQAVTDGAFKVSIDGVEQSVTGLDFSDAESYDDIATAINGKLTGATCAYDETANDNQGGFLFTSNTTGATSKVSKLSSPSSGTDISGTSYLNGANNPRIINGQNAGATENLVSAIVRTKGAIYYFGILATVTPTAEDTINLARYVQTQDKLLFIGRNAEADIEDVFKAIHDATLTHTRCLYYTLGAKEARVAAAAYASRLFGINFNGSQTMCTMHLKSLAGILPDPNAAENAVLLKAEQYGFDVYVSIAGMPAVMSFGANYYSDEIYGQLWFKLALEVAGFNYLATTNTKIPQNEIGMSGLKNAYAEVCKQAITNGFASAGLTWQSPTTFGNPSDLRRNITDVGYYIYSQPIALQSPSERAARKAPLVQIAIKQAGAIHHSDVIVQVN